jgi:hypothetical protein
MNLDNVIKLRYFGYAHLPIFCWKKSVLTQLDYLLSSKLHLASFWIIGKRSNEYLLVMVANFSDRHPLPNRCRVAFKYATKQRMDWSDEV